MNGDFIFAPSINPLYDNAPLVMEGEGVTEFFGGSDNTPQPVVWPSDDSQVAPDTSNRIFDKLSGVVSTSLSTAINAALGAATNKLRSELGQSEKPRTLWERFFGAPTNEPILTVGTKIEVPFQQWIFIFGVVGLLIVGLLGFGFIKR
jgi:hypothetical protein